MVLCFANGSEIALSIYDRWAVTLWRLWMGVWLEVHQQNKANRVAAVFPHKYFRHMPACKLNLRLFCCGAIDRGEQSPLWCKLQRNTVWGRGWSSPCIVAVGVYTCTRVLIIIITFHRKTISNRFHVFATIQPKGIHHHRKRNIMTANNRGLSPPTTLEFLLCLETNSENNRTRS